MLFFRFLRYINQFIQTYFFTIFSLCTLWNGQKKNEKETRLKWIEQKKKLNPWRWLTNRNKLWVGTYSLKRMPSATNYEEEKRMERGRGKIGKLSDIKKRKSYQLTKVETEDRTRWGRSSRYLPDRGISGPDRDLSYLSIKFPIQIIYLSNIYQGFPW